MHRVLVTGMLDFPRVHTSPQAFERGADGPAAPAQLLRSTKLNAASLATERRMRSQREMQGTKDLDLKEHARLVQPRGKPAKSGKARKEEQPRRDALAAARSKAAQARHIHTLRVRSVSQGRSLSA